MATWLDNKLLLLDGGFGTTLEDVFGKDISGPLWSAKLVDKEPETIVAAHLAFFNVSSKVILTSTYQCAFETFERAGYSKGDAVRLMRNSVRLASEAKEKYEGDTEQVHIALSIGPYGATLSPAQEFDGIYPPPYGPKAYTVNSENTNAFEGDDAAIKEKAATIALADFHYERLKIYATSGEGSVWPLIDMIAFETVPLMREIFAIRMAMARLKVDLEAQGLAYKPWWISTVWPSGVHPQESTPGGPRYPVDYVTFALLRDHLLPGTEADEERVEIAVPDGIGINCTHVGNVSQVLESMRDTVITINKFSRQNKPFLVLYPNAGNIYDIVNHRWVPEEEKLGVSLDPEDWAQSTSRFASVQLPSGVWRGVLVGGCCKTTPSHIELLGKYVKILAK